MVEVTKLNFEEMLLPVEKAIKNASFIAIDTEFTGLNVGPDDEARLFDTLGERYQKLKCRATNFVPCQIGLSMFTKMVNENSYSVETYVFFIRPYMCGSNDRRFMFQASALEFLSKYDFDFNKFFKEGIPYLNDVEESQAIKEIEEGTLSYTHEKLRELRPKREQDIKINNGIRNSVQLHGSSAIHKAPETNEGNKVILPKEKGCHEYFELCELRRKYPSLWAYSKDDSIIIEVVSTEKRKELEKNTKDEEKKVIDFFLGFTKVFRILKEAQKPIVGHNLLMDLMLFFENFYKPLPKSYAEFKKELHALFPIIFDTRHIWLNIKLFYNFKELPRQSSLFDLYEIFKNSTDDLSTLFSPGIHLNNNDKYLTGEFPHESGYDSFVTGWVFLKICHLLAMKKINNPILVQPQTFKQHLSAVSPFLNKLNLGRSREKYLNVSGEDPLPQVSEFLHISHKNARNVLNQVELCRQFDKYPMVEFKLARNRRSAIIVVGSLGSFKDILRDFKNDPDYIVTKYSVFRHSPIVTAALWVTALGSSCLVAFFLSKLYRQ